MMRFIVLLCSSAADPTPNFRSVIFLSKITSLRLLQNTAYMLQTAGRYHAKRFRKAQCPVVERLTNSLMTHGRNSGKKLMAVGIIKHTMGIYLLTDQNPIQVIMDAVINSGPREDATRIGSAGVVRRQAVDNSPLRRVNQAVYLFTTGARESSFRSIKTIAAESEVQYGTFISGAEESEIQCVANNFPDQQKLEKRNNFPQKVVLEIIKIIRNNGNDLESRLSVGASRLSVYSITEIFEVLNSQRISGLRFIEWIWNNNPQLHENAHICSLIIDNLGRLDNYETMSALLKKFRSKNICLTFEAFGFLPVVSPNSIQKSTQKVVDLLNKIGGSCRSSGICALIEMFSKLDLFEMARFVINITERKESYYCILVREKCYRGLIEDGHGIIREMRELHLAPGTTVYNYLLGSSYKNCSIDKAFAVLGEMNEIGIPPDAITFEVLILFVCRLSKMDAVHQLLDQMVCRGLEPRPSTHAAIVKALFSAEKYPEAHKYVVDSCIAYKKSSNMMYSLIASLYREKGDIMSSFRVLVEMMERCLKPNFNVYIKIVKQLKRIGRRNLARDLENRYSKFVTESPARQP